MISMLEADELCRSLQDKVISPAKARGATNRFILKHLRDGFCAGTPKYAFVQKEPVWIVPIVWARPQLPPVEIGEVIVQALEGAIIGFTPPAEVLKNARAAIT